MHNEKVTDGNPFRVLKPSNLVPVVHDANLNVRSNQERETWILSYAADTKGQIYTTGLITHRTG